LVDLELRKAIEILPDRREETVRAWLLAHPEIEVVSRDRGGAYAAAAKKGAPQAQQIADKFHLLLNLREKLKELMARKQKLLPHIETICSRTRANPEPGGSSGSTQAAASSTVELSKPFRHMSPYPRAIPSGSVALPAEETPSQISHTNRYARYAAVRTLHQQLVSQREIARRLKLSRNTVRKFLQAETFPERRQRPYRGSILDPYKPYILERWKAGCWNGMQILEEIEQLGYTGSEAPLRYFLTQVRKQHRAAGTALALDLSTAQGSIGAPADLPAKSTPKCRMSPARASWLWMCELDKLDAQQRKLIEQIRAAHPDLETAYPLSQAFVSMLAEHRAQDLDDWLLQAKQSGIRELKSFAQGIRRDYAAVKAAFTSAWSNGQVEAQVNCLKLQKRLMFGRANFDLLRLHVLRRA
jgi:transposase